MLQFIETVGSMTADTTVRGVRYGFIIEPDLGKWRAHCFVRTSLYLAAVFDSYEDAVFFCNTEVMRAESRK